MYVLITRRVVKHNTGTTEKFAPRTSNHEEWHVCGPFLTIRMAERAAIAALATHTCLSAEVRNAAYIRGEWERRSSLEHYRSKAIETALSMVGKEGDVS